MRYVPPEELASVWEEAAQWIDFARLRLGERLTREEIYHALRSNLAALYMIDDVGIVVCQRVVETDGTVSLFVWLISGKLKNWKDEMIRRLEELAAQIKATRIKMRSPRRGWERAMGNYWTPVDIIYEHRLGE